VRMRGVDCGAVGVPRRVLSGRVNTALPSPPGGKRSGCWQGPLGSEPSSWAGAPGVGRARGA